MAAKCTEFPTVALCERCRPTAGLRDTRGDGNLADDLLVAFGVSFGVSNSITESSTATRDTDVVAVALCDLLRPFTELPASGCNCFTRDDRPRPDFRGDIEPSMESLEGRGELERALRSETDGIVGINRLLEW